MTGTKYKLLNQLTVLHDYIEENLEGINDKQAGKALSEVMKLWTLIERRAR